MTHQPDDRLKQTLDYALAYLACGLSVIPCRRQPILDWTPYQKTKANEAQLQAWFSDNFLNPAIVTGAVSGQLIALHFDSVEIYESWAAAYPQAAASATIELDLDQYVLLRLSGQLPASQPAFYQGQPIGQLYSEGAYIFAPPAIDSTGFDYHWYIPPWQNLVELASLADIGITLEQAPLLIELPHKEAQPPAQDAEPAERQPSESPSAEGLSAEGQPPSESVNPTPTSSQTADPADLPPRTRVFIHKAQAGEDIDNLDQELYLAAWQYGKAGFSQAETCAELLGLTEHYYPDSTTAQTLIKIGWHKGDLGQDPWDSEPRLPQNHFEVEAALAHQDERRKFLPNFREVDGQMYYLTWKTIDGQIVANERLIAPFVARIVEKTVLFNDQERRAVYKIEGKKGKRRFQAEVAAEDWADPRKLTATILHHLPGKPPDVEARMRSHWGPAIAAMTDEKTMTEKRALASTGWSPEGKAFVLPGGSVGQGYDCKLDADLHHELKHFGLKEISSDQQKEVVQALFNLRQIYKPAVINTLIAHAFLPPLVRFVGSELRYLYHIHAQTGSLKTELAKIIISLYGPQGDQAITYKWSATPYGAESRAHALKDCLMLVDDLKPGTISPSDQAKWVAFVQAAVDAQGRKRATIAGKAALSLPPRALLLSTGEAVPEAGESSYTARMLLAEVNKQPADRNKRLDQIKALTPHFSGLMYAYIQWLIAGGSQQVSPSYDQIKAQTLAIEANHARLAANYASNRLGAVIFARFCTETGLINEAEGAAFLADHETGLRQIVNDTAKKVRSERYSYRFIDALNDAISVAHVVLAETYDTKGKRIGWQDDNYMYLLSGAKEVIDQWLWTRERNPINIPKKELYRQLYDDGLIRSTQSRVQKGRYDYQIEDPATGKRTLVLALDTKRIAAIFGLTDEDNGA